MTRTWEAEVMDDPLQAVAYAAADFSEVNARFVRRALQISGSVNASLRVVDLGCGPGSIVIELARARPTWRFVAVDASIPMLEIACKTCPMPRNITSVHDDVKTLGCVTGRFDLILSNSLLHHLPDPHLFWQAVRRLGRAGSVVLVCDLVRPPSPKVAQDLVDRHAATESELLRGEFYRSLLASFTVGEVREQLRQAGLDTLVAEPVSDRHVEVFGRLADLR